MVLNIQMFICNTIMFIMDDMLRLTQDLYAGDQYGL